MAFFSLNQDLFITGQSAQTTGVNNILTATSGTAATDTLIQTSNISYQSFSVQIVSSGTGGTFVFEGSNDNTNFVTIPVYNNLTPNTTPVTSTITATSSAIVYNGALTFRYLRCRIVTTITGGSIQAFTRLSCVSLSFPPLSQVLAAGNAGANLGKAEDAASANADTGVFCLGVRSDQPTTATTSNNGDYSQINTDKYGHILDRDYATVTKTYSASANIVTGASPTDIFTITGNGTTNVFITKIIISGTQTTAGLADIQIVKRSSADTGGTSSSVTAIPHDSGDAAASATLLAYTAPPSGLGAAVGSVRRGFLPIAGATSVVNPIVEFNFGALGKPMILIGTAQQIAVNAVSLTAGGTFDISVEWFEI